MDQETAQRWVILRRRFLASAGASAVVASVLDVRGAFASAAKPKTFIMSRGLSPQKVPGGTRWLLSHFREPITRKVAGTPFSVELACAIACQESGYAWFTSSVQGHRSGPEILRLLVLDAVGGRSVFPHNTAASALTRASGD